MNKQIKSLLLLLFICPIICLSQEDCFNGIDDDGDGLIDLNDSTDCSCLDPNLNPINNSLIPNHSFEDYSCCPTSHSSLSCAENWVQATNTTSDYFNSCGYIPTSAPTPVPDGNGFAGMFITEGYKEYIGACLTSPMIAGQEYSITLDIASLSVNGQLEACSAPVYDPLDFTIYGVPFCISFPHNIGTACPETMGWSVLGSTTYTPSPTWGTLTITFTPSQDIYAIMLGSPCVLPSNYPVYSVLGGCYPYFFVDNLVLDYAEPIQVEVTQNGSICSNTSVLSATANASGGTWQWYYEGVALVGETSNTLTLSNVGNQAGLYTARYTLSGECGTENILVVSDNDDPSFSVNNFCLGSSNMATNIATPGGTFTFNPIPNDGATLNSSTGEIINGVIGTTYTVEYTTGGNCSASQQETVTVLDSDDASFAYSENVVCISGANPFVTILNTPGGQFSVTPNGLSINPSNGSINLDNSSTGVYTIEYTTNGICSATEQTIITVLDGPSADFYYPSTCISGNNLSPIAINGGTFGVFSSNSGISVNPETGEIDLSNLTPGQYTITNTVSASGCPPVSFDTTLTIFPPPTASLDGGGTYCSGEQIPDVIINLNGEANFNATYTINGTSFSITTTETTFIIPEHEEGDYTLISISDNRCDGEVSSSIVSVTENPIPVINPIQDLTVCNGDLINIPPFTSSPQQGFTWNVVNNDIGTGMNGIGNIPPFTATYNSNSPIESEIEVFATANGCTSESETFTITVNNSPDPGFSVGSEDLCLPYTLVLTADDPTVTGTWFVNQDTIGNGTSVQHTLVTEGCYSVTHQVVDHVGCTNTLTIPAAVCLDPAPIASFSFSPSSPLSTINTAVHFTNTSQFSNNYIWDFGDNTQSGDTHPTHNYSFEDGGSYLIQLIAENTNGCPDTTYQLIEIIEEPIVYVPNAFTPDGDQNNNIFCPLFYAGFDPYDYNLTIYNRWGELIFESYNYAIGWDGTYGGKIAPDGVYVWKIIVSESSSDKKREMVGHVNLLR